jgi:UDP-N-acetylglucosamine:LPS N-acetylglucosamine transferase
VLEDYEIFFITYDSYRTRELKNAYLFDNIGSNFIKMLLNIPNFLSILFKEKPDIFISTGAEIAVPFFYLAKLFNIYTIYIESYSRVLEPSMTGMLVYPVSDIFLVQWEYLLKKYGNKARYEGSVL